MTEVFENYREAVSMNTGIATVTPVSYLADVLYGEAAKSDRLAADIAVQDRTASAEE